MRRSVAAGLHCSSWDDEQGGTRHRARAARLFMTAQAECGHICPMTMTHASVASLRFAPDLFAEWLPRILSRTYDRAFRPAADKRGVTIGMGMTEKQGGTDVRGQYQPGRAGGRRSLPDHRPQMVHVGADVRCLPGAGQGRRGAEPCSWCRGSCPTVRSTPCVSNASRTNSATGRTPRRRSSSTVPADFWWGRRAAASPRSWKW